MSKSAMPGVSQPLLGLSEIGANVPRPPGTAMTFYSLSFYIPWSASASPDYVQCGFNLSCVCELIIHCIHFLSKSILQSLSPGVPPSVKLIDVMRADPLIRYALKLSEVYLTI